MKMNLELQIVKPLMLSLLTILALLSSISQAESEHEGEVNQAKLEQILAPIALYPDTILSHILVASTYPLEVVQAERWLGEQEAVEPPLAGQEAVEAAQNQDWDPSVQALVAFPQILKRMSEDLEWTQQLGEAFLQDQEQVLNSVQNLRELAQREGSLDKMDRVTITQDEQSIIIEPRDREIVYVPYYDSRVVYGDWRWAHYQPVYWDYPYSHAGFYDRYYPHSRHASFFFWGPRVSLSFGFFSNTFHWRNRHLVRISPRHYRPYRYYGHRDILRHRHATRWVHDSARRHHNGHRQSVSRENRRSENRRDRTQNEFANGARAGQRDQRIERGQRREYLNQQRVRERLANSRGNRIQSNRILNSRSTRTNSQNQAQSNQDSSNQSVRAANNNSARNPRVASHDRARAGEDARRVANRPATRPSNRQSMVVTPKPRANRAPANRASANRAPANRAPANRASAQTAPPRAVSPPKNPPAARQTAKPKPTIVRRDQTPARASKNSRRNRQQPR